MHEFFQNFTPDPNTSETPQTPFIYDSEWVDRYFDRHAVQGKLHFAIMLENRVIGDVYLKHIDPASHSCELGIHLVGDEFKGKSYGTQAIRMILDYAFSQLQMKTVRADALKKNHPSIKALIKSGFHQTHESQTYIYYEVKAPDNA